MESVADYSLVLNDDNSHRGHDDMLETCSKFDSSYLCLSQGSEDELHFESDLPGTLMIIDDADDWLQNNNIDSTSTTDYEDIPKSDSNRLSLMLAESGSGITDRSSNKELDDDGNNEVLKFDKLYNMSIYETERLSKTPLFNGSSTTVMDALVAYLGWFSEHPGISKEALSEILRVQHDQILPSENKLPSSYDEAIKLVEPFLIKPKVYHACPKDCILFREEFKDLTICPQCGSSRYIELKVPAKRFAYLPVGPRLVRLFGTPNFSTNCSSTWPSCRQLY